MNEGLRQGEKKVEKRREEERRQSRAARDIWFKGTSLKLNLNFSLNQVQDSELGLKLFDSTMKGG